MPFAVISVIKTLRPTYQTDEKMMCFATEVHTVFTSHLLKGL